MDYDGKDHDKILPREKRFNFGMSDVHAAILMVQLKALQEDLSRRALIARSYQEAMDDRIGSQGYREERVWYRFVIKVRNPIKTIKHFHDNGIEVIRPIAPSELLHRQLGLSRCQFPKAERIAATTISLPIWTGMTDEEVGRVVSALKELPI